MRSPFSYILKDRIRQQIMLYRNWWLTYTACLVVCVLIFINWKSVFLLAIEYKEYIKFVLVGFSVFIVFRRYPIIMINPATVFFIDNRRKIYEILYIKITLMICFCAFIGAFLTIVVNLSMDLYIWVYYFLFFLFVTMSAWTKYQHLSLSVVALFCVAAIIFFSEILVLSILFDLFCILVQAKKTKKIDWDKYMRDMKMMYQSIGAGARKDWGGMIQYANMNAIKEKYIISYPKKVRVHPLIVKSLLDNLRFSRETWMIVFLSIIVLFYILKVDILNPFTNLIFVIVWNFSICTILKHSIETMLKMKELQERGLFLPYSLKTISIYYALCVIIAMAFLQIMLFGFSGIVDYSLRISEVCVSTLLYAGVFLLSHYFVIYYGKQNNLLTAAISCVNLLITAFMIL